MKPRFLFSLLCVLLAGCAVQPPTPTSAKPAECVPLVVATPAAPVPSEVDELLAYHRSLRRLLPADLAKELARLNLKPATPRLALQKAMVLTLVHGNGDLLRAQVFLDGVLNSIQSEAEPLKPLARLLAANAAELQRVSEQLEKSIQQARDGQRRVEQLNGMLEGLKAIERTLPVRPSAALPTHTQ